MKKVLSLFILVLLIAGISIAAAPTVEESNVVIFKVADQETASSWSISNIVWISGANTAEIGATHGFLLEDGAGVEIASGGADGPHPKQGGGQFFWWGCPTSPTSARNSSVVLGQSGVTIGCEL